jgi:hypothetical protein
MKFVIRDDDVNYFSKPSDIIRWYDDIFTQAIPVGFAAIPFVKPSGDKYPIPMPATDEEYPISKNTELLDYIKSNSLIEILQHGTTHETKDEVFEYQREKDFLEDIKRGKTELEAAFDRQVSVFVPPHDWVGASGVLAIEASHMNIIRGRGTGLRNIIFRPAYFVNFCRMFAFKFLQAWHGDVPAYPFVLDFGKHKEACSYRLEDTDVFDGLEYVYKKNGVFVVVAHVHTLTLEKKERLMKLISRARELGAEFVRPSELFSHEV